MSEEYTLERTLLEEEPVNEVIFGKIRDPIYKEAIEFSHNTQEYIVQKGQQIKDFVVNNTVDSTSINMLFTPVYVPIDTVVTGLTKAESIDMRIFAASLGYGGLGVVMSGGRNLWNKGFGITDDSSERAKAISDSGYAATFAAAFLPPLYLAMGAEFDLNLLAGTATGATINAIFGRPMGLLIDSGRQLLDMESTLNPLPESITNKPGWFKKALFGLAVGGSLFATWTGYQVLDKYIPKEETKQEIVIHNQSDIPTINYIEGKNE